MKRVLLIDDDNGILYIVKRWLESVGDVVVKTASSGKDAIDAIEENEWDLVVSDVFLPDNDGLSITKQIGQSKQKCPVLLMTGNLNIDVAYRAINQQVQGLLEKPLKKQDFLAKVHDLLAKDKLTNNVKTKNILAIGAHPDDVEIGCGGILLKHRNLNDNINILTLSGGEQGGEAGIRAREAKSASIMLRAELFLKELKDTEISSNGSTISIIQSVIDIVRPDIVYTHSINDNHQDHRNTHLASIVACRGVPQLECYQSPSSTIEFRPSRYVDITDEMEEKVGLVASYASQWHKCQYLNESLIESTAEYWGRFAGYRKVEPLEVIRCE